MVPASPLTSTPCWPPQIFYNILIQQDSEQFRRFGRRPPFERLWQNGLPSHHLSYFSPGTLKRLAVAHGFEEIDSFCLDSLHVSGLWHRLRSTSSLTASAAMYLPLAALSLVCRLLPPDIHVSVFRSSP